MVKIEFTAPVVVTDESDVQITDWAMLSQMAGTIFPDTTLTDCFGGTPDEMAVAVLLERGGTIQLATHLSQSALVATSLFRSKRLLSDEEFGILRRHVEGSWSDGAGSYLAHDDLNIHIIVDKIDGNQNDDGVESVGSGTADLYPAIRRADLAAVRDALDRGESIKSSLCGTNPLEWAVSYADADIASLLIDRGVDVHAKAWDSSTVLSSCAASRHFADKDAAIIARKLLAIRGFAEPELRRTADVAELRGKTELLSVVLNHLNT